MTALSRHSHLQAFPTDWEADALQLLDERHVVAVSGSTERRGQFGEGIARAAGRLAHTQVCTLYGRFITDLDSFCYQLERSLPGPRLDRRIDGPSGVVNFLRSRASRPAPRHRFYVWNDADVLLHHDRELFGRLLDAICGVAAEAEYVSDDLLLLHRLVAVGGLPLSAYAADPHGQCASWYSGEGEEPFWLTVTGLEAPPIETVTIDTMVA